MNPCKSTLLLPLLLVVVVGCLSCGRQRARERVLEAVNPREVLIPNGQACVLDAKTNYLAIVPSYVRHNEIRYRVFVSENGEFDTNSEPVQAGVATATTLIEIGGVRVYVGYGGDNTTSVTLDIGDAQTGIAPFPTNDLGLIKPSKLEFKRGKSLSADDLMESIGVKTGKPRNN